MAVSFGRCVYKSGRVFCPPISAYSGKSAWPSRTDGMLFRFKRHDAAVSSYLACRISLPLHSRRYALENWSLTPLWEYKNILIIYKDCSRRRGTEVALIEWRKGKWKEPLRENAIGLWRKEWDAIVYIIDQHIYEYLNSPLSVSDFMICHWCDFIACQWDAQFSVFGFVDRLGSFLPQQKKS